jgi:Family of unknown function (DUF5397)
MLLSIAHCEEQNMQAVVEAPVLPIGKIKSFGPLGPKYKVGRALRPLSNGDWMVEVLLVETGETAEYKLTRLCADPEAM